MARVFLILFLCISSFGVSADPAAANLFSCKGYSGRTPISASFEGSSFRGEAQFSITIGKSAYSASGQDISLQDTAIGTLVTMFRRQSFDAYIDTLTLVKPRVNVEFGDKRQFNTRIYATRNLTTIAGPDFVSGVVQNNNTALLSCTAQFVLF